MQGTRWRGMGLLFETKYFPQLSDIDAHADYEEKKYSQETEERGKRKSEWTEEWKVGIKLME